MKKIICFLGCLVMILSFTSFAFAMDFNDYGYPPIPDDQFTKIYPYVYLSEGTYSVKLFVTDIPLETDKNGKFCVYSPVKYQKYIYDSANYTWVADSYSGYHTNGSVCLIFDPITWANTPIYNHHTGDLVYDPNPPDVPMFENIQNVSNDSLPYVFANILSVLKVLLPVGILIFAGFIGINLARRLFSSI